MSAPPPSQPRRINADYAHGDLVKVARTQNQAEAEFVEALLAELGIPSMLRRSPGADLPDYLAAGPRDVLVPESGAQAAREALAWKDAERADGRRDAP
jgi:hypothetical protein